MFELEKLKFNLEIILRTKLANFVFLEVPKSYKKSTLCRLLHKRSISSINEDRLKNVCHEVISSKGTFLK